MCILYSIFMVEIVENKNVRFFIGFNFFFVIFVLGRPWASNIRESWSCSQLWTAKSSFCHRPSVGDGILKAGHVQHQLQLPGFWDLCIKALTFTSCLGQSRPPSSLGLFQYLQHLTFLAAISSERCQCLMIFTAVAGSELQLKAQHFLHDAALQSPQWPRGTLHANHPVVVDHIRCSSRHHQCLSSMISDLIIQEQEFVWFTEGCCITPEWWIIRIVPDMMSSMHQYVQWLRDYPWRLHGLFSRRLGG